MMKCVDFIGVCEWRLNYRWKFLCWCVGEPASVSAGDTWGDLPKMPPTMKTNGYLLQLEFGLIYWTRTY